MQEEQGNMTVTVTVLTGESAGKTAAMPDNVDPLALLVAFAKEDVRWEVNWTEATHSELTEWTRADLVGRILAALHHGRYVRFELPTGIREWRLYNPLELTPPVHDDEARQAVGEIEDLISDGGWDVYVLDDTDKGVIIGTHGQSKR
jgi:hypothetical protein